jgi:predicted SprT family Zn-dependent metalloprotease
MKQDCAGRKKYFDDADIEINPEMLIKVSWQTVKKTIEKKVEAYLKQKK